MDDAALPYDGEFRAAFRYFLDERGWSATEFCDRTRATDDSPRRVNPSSVSDWLNRRKHPSNQAVMVVCDTFEVPRSYFFQVGEDLERSRRERESQRRRRRIAEELDLEAIKIAVTQMSSAQLLEALEALTQVLRGRGPVVEDGKPRVGG